MEIITTTTTFPESGLWSNTSYWWVPVQAKFPPYKNMKWDLCERWTQSIQDYFKLLHVMWSLQRQLQVQIQTPWQILSLGKPELVSVGIKQHTHHFIHPWEASWLCKLSYLCKQWSDHLPTNPCANPALHSAVVGNSCCFLNRHKEMCHYFPTKRKIRVKFTCVYVVHFPLWSFWLFFLTHLIPSHCVSFSFL